MFERDFCQECGTRFPPREGEGRCKTWQECAAKQTARQWVWHIEELQYMSLETR